MIRRAYPGLITVLAFLLGACSTFHLVDGNFHPKGKSLAIISGLTDETTLLAVKYMTEGLEKNSRFHVLSQKQVAQAVPHYPQHIKGPYNSAYLEIDVGYSKTDVGKIGEIQKRLGVDYLYVLWAPTTTSYRGAIRIGGNYPLLHIVAQLFEFPSGKEIGHGRYAARADTGHNEKMRKDIEAAAKEFAEKTGMLK